MYELFNKDYAEALDQLEVDEAALVDCAQMSKLFIALGFVNGNSD